MKRCFAMALFLLVPGPRHALADGGLVRISERAGSLRVTVFTSPTPLRAGPVDFSVLVQDAETGSPVQAAHVEVLVSRHEGAGLATSYIATRASATNQLFQDVCFNLPGPGEWRAEVIVKQRESAARTAFLFEAAGPLPRWRELWVWVVLPIPMIALYSLHQILVYREKV